MPACLVHTDSMMRAEELQTLQLAARSIGLSEPNPRVGCVIVTPDGQRVEGHTQAPGSHHAEAQALAQARAKGLSLEGATAWVTLEPCCHHGRTPPCSDALLAAGISRVHVAMVDPFPAVAGQGVAQLRAAGVEVVVHDDEWSRAAAWINIGFLSRMVRGRPWIRMKAASSLDGATALLNGKSQWITGEAARADGHAWRRRAGAVLTGIGTVRDDDPRLDVRLVPTDRQPVRVVVDSRLEISPLAKVLQAPGTCWIYCVQAEPHRKAALEALPGVEVCVVPGSPEGKTDLAAVASDLARRGINELHLEAGAQLMGSWLREGLVDEVLLYQAPVLLGAGRPLARWTPQPLESLHQGLPLQLMDTKAVGPDLRIRALTSAGQRFAPDRDPDPEPADAPGRRPWEW